MPPPVLHHHLPAASTHLPQAHIPTHRHRIRNPLLFRVKLLAELRQHGLLGFVQGARSGVCVFGKQAVRLFLFEVALHTRDALVRAGATVGRRGRVDGRLEEHRLGLGAEDGRGDDGQRLGDGRVGDLAGLGGQSEAQLCGELVAMRGWRRGLLLVLRLGVLPVVAASTPSYNLGGHASIRLPFTGRHGIFVRKPLEHHVSLVVAESEAAEVEVHELSAGGLDGGAGTGQLLCGGASYEGILRGSRDTAAAAAAARPLVVAIDRRQGLVPAAVVGEDDVLKAKLLDGLLMGRDQRLQLGSVHGGITNLQVAQPWEMDGRPRRPGGQGRHGRGDLVEELLGAARRRKQDISRQGNGTRPLGTDPGKGELFEAV